MKKQVETTNNKVKTTNNKVKTTLEELATETEQEVPEQEVPETIEQKTNDLYDSYFLFFHKNKDEDEFMYVQPFMYKKLLNKDINNINSPKAILEPRQGAPEDDDVFIYCPDPNSELKSIAKVERSKVFTSELKDGKVAFSFMLDTLFQKIDEGVIQLPPIKKYAVSKDEFRLERVFENDEKAKREALKQQKNESVSLFYKEKKEKEELQAKIEKLQKDYQEKYDLYLKLLLNKNDKSIINYEEEKLNYINVAINYTLNNVIKGINNQIKGINNQIKLITFIDKSKIQSDIKNKNVIIYNDANYDNNSFFNCIRRQKQKSDTDMMFLLDIKTELINYDFIEKYKDYYNKNANNEEKRLNLCMEQSNNNSDLQKIIIQHTEFYITDKVLELLKEKFECKLVIIKYSGTGNNIKVEQNPLIIENNKTDYLFLARNAEYKYFIISINDNIVFNKTNRNNIPEIFSKNISIF